VSIANSETRFHDYEGAPIGDSGPYGTYAACDPMVIDDLKWLGIKMVSTANNHVVDYGEVGIETNMQNLKHHGMPFAGTGRNLSEAAAPTYLDTPKGSVALIGVTLTMPPADHRAGDPPALLAGGQESGIFISPATR
jgi:poly-gamma-glutamate capsule biosynthesis protein CapA/YwtB (metallophosphatase superfamily)